MNKVVEEETKVLSKATPITVALALGLCAGAFWVGTLSNTVFENKNDIQINLKDLKEHTRQINKATVVLDNLVERVEKVEDKK